jgi:endoglucanase
MNIAGFNLPITSLGRTSPSSASSPSAPLTPPLVELGGPDGAGQMAHFARDLGHNMFRLPVTWQYLTGGRGGSALDEVAWVRYGRLVERCLESSKVARCVVDLHNFGRYEGEVSGPCVCVLVEEFFC